MARAEEIELQKIYSRRFGPGFAKPCFRPTVTECSLWVCQKRDRCRLASDDNAMRAYHDALGYAAKEAVRVAKIRGATIHPRVAALKAEERKDG